MSYSVSIEDWESLSKEEQDECVQIVSAGGAVENAEKLRKYNISVAVGRYCKKIVAVGAIKKVRSKYIKKNSKKAKYTQLPMLCELGYISTDSHHERKGLAADIIECLLDSHYEPLYATTYHPGMKKLLQRAGFCKQGNEWTGRTGNILSLWTNEDSFTVTSK